MKKFCAWLLALLMLVTIIPVEQIPGLQVILFDVVKANDEPSQTVVESGKCGETASWVITKDKYGAYTITYSGTGAIWAPDILSDYDEISMVIENGITEISDEGFYGSLLQLRGDLIIPNSVTKIGINAFKYSHFNGRLVLSNQLQSVGDGAFSYCDVLSGTIDIPETLTSYSASSFGFNDESYNDICFVNDKFDLSPFTNQLVIPSVKWQSNNEEVATVDQNGHVICVSPGNCVISAEFKDATKNYNFEVLDKDNCSGQCDENTAWKITKKKDGTHQIVFSGTGRISAPSILSSYDQISIVIKNGITEIADEAFLGRDNLTGSLVIPDSVTSIGCEAFSMCDNLTGNLFIPDSVKEIGERTFYRCSRLHGKLTLPNQLTKIGDKAFAYCEFNGNLVIPNSVISIGDSVFEDAGFDGKLTLSNQLETIGDWAFTCCGFNGNLVIPNSVISIGDSAFRDAGFDGKLTLSNRLETIGDNAFDGCYKLKGKLEIPDSLVTYSMNSFGYQNDHMKDWYEDLSVGDLIRLNPMSTSLVLPWKVKWSSGNKKIAKVDQTGRVKIVGPGKCKVYAKCNGKVLIYNVSCKYGSAVFTWGKDYKTCKVTYTSKKNKKEKYTYKCTVTSSKTKATTKKDGIVTYVAKYGRDQATVRKVYAKKITSATLAKATVVYTGKSIKPKITVKLSDGKTLSSNYYSVKYTNNKNIGTATATITLKGNYSGTIKKTFKILPKTTTISSAKGASKAITVKWKKNSTVTGYQIQVATNKSFTKNCKTYTVSGAENTSNKITELTGNKNYYIRIRCYKTVNGKKYYSSWKTYSKTVKTKK